MARNGAGLKLGATALLGVAVALTFSVLPNRPAPEAIWQSPSLLGRETESSRSAAGLATSALESATPEPSGPTQRRKAATESGWTEFRCTAFADLVRTLENPSSARSTWDLELAAVARSLDGTFQSELLALLSAPARQASERVAAAELLHAVQRLEAETRDSTCELCPLPGPALDALRAASMDPGPCPLLRAAAQRALAVFGTAEDRAALVARLADPSDPDARNVAAWGLRSARDSSVLTELANLACRGEDSGAAESALIAIDGLLRAPARMEALPAVRAELAREISRLACDSTAPRSLRLRSMVVLGATDSVEGGEALWRVLEDPSADQGLARAAVQAWQAREAASAASATGAGPREILARAAHPLAAAEALVLTAGGAQLDPALNEDLRFVLRHSAGAERPLSERRRAVVALAQLQDPLDTEWFEQTAQQESDPFLSETMARALGRFTSR